MSKISCCVFTSLLVSIACHAADVNVALNKPVTLNSFYPEFVATVAPCPGVSSLPQKPASSIVDGIFLPESKCFQNGVYWNKQNSGNTIDINLGGTFLLSSAIVQADADTYTLQYRDAGGVYRNWWVVPPGTHRQGTMETRPNSSDNTQRQRLPSVLATGLRFFTPAGTFDGEYAVSEIQVFGVSANLIDIGNNLVNPTLAGTPGRCPTNWVCDGSPEPGFSSYTPTTAQYPGGLPFKTAGYSPTVFGGSGTVRQTTALTWVAGNTYVLNLWKGLPKTLPDGTTPVAGWAPTARVYLTTEVREEVASFDIPSPAKGAFEANPITFTLPANSPFIGKKIAVVIFQSSPSLFSANFAIAPIFSEVAGAVEVAYAKILSDIYEFRYTGAYFSGWVNFSGTSGGIEVDMLRDGDGPSACNPPCSSDALWENIARFKPDLQPRTPVANAGKQYSWQIDVESYQIPFRNKFLGPFGGGGTQRVRFRPFVNPDSGLSQPLTQRLPVILGSEGFQRRLPEWIFADDSQSLVSWLFSQPTTVIPHCEWHNARRRHNSQVLPVCWHKFGWQRDVHRRKPFHKATIHRSVHGDTICVFEFKTRSHYCLLQSGRLGDRTKNALPVQ